MAKKRRSSSKKEKRMRLQFKTVLGLAATLTLFISMYLFLPEASGRKIVEILTIVSTYGIGLSGSALVIMIFAMIFQSKTPKRLIKM